jgi:acetylxylan esterase
MSPIRFAALFLLGANLAAAQCPGVHVFGARETTAPPGFGSAGPVVSSIVSAFPGTTSEVINYPACGGQASCGGASYASSVIQGVTAVANQVNAFNRQCPSSVLVLVGYSQVHSTFRLCISYLFADPST